MKGLIIFIFLSVSFVSVIFVLNAFYGLFVSYNWESVREQAAAISGGLEEFIETMGENHSDYY